MRDDDDDNLYDDHLPVRKHTGFGIASFLIAIVVGLAEFAVILVAGVIGAENPNGVDENSKVVMGIGLGVCGGMAVAVCGLGMAVAGLCQSERNKTFAVLGLILNGLIVAGVLFLIVLGMMMG